jgi:hypothetical protein
MNRHAWAALLLGMLAATGCQPPPASTSKPATTAPPPPPGSSSPAGVSIAAQPSGDKSDALLAAYRAAHANRDLQALLNLYWFGNADDEMRLTIRENAAAELRCPLVSAELTPAAPGENGPRTEGGIRWRPSLDVVAVLSAKFDTSQAPVGGYYAERLQLTVGERGGRYYFTVPIRE